MSQPQDDSHLITGPTDYVTGWEFYEENHEDHFNQWVEAHEADHHLEQSLIGQEVQPWEK